MIPATLLAKPALSAVRGAPAPIATPEKPAQTEAAKPPSTGHGATVPTVTPAKPAQTGVVPPSSTALGAAFPTATPINPAQTEAMPPPAAGPSAALSSTERVAPIPSKDAQAEVVPPPTATMIAQPIAPKEPPIFPQMGATTLGAAVGSAIGNTNTLFNESSDKKTAATPAAQSAQQDPCAMEIKEFLQCAIGRADLNVCAAFREALRQCKVSANIQ